MTLANMRVAGALMSAMVVCSVSLQVCADQPARVEHGSNMVDGWPFDASEAQRRQQETAERLGVPVWVDLPCDNASPIRLVLIPAGAFMMGSPESEPERFPDEGPSRRVVISRPFYMGVHEVTTAQYHAIVGTKLSGAEKSDAPAVRISWNMAADACRRLGRATGRTVRLPTEAEWEYACRAGTATAYHLGATISRDRAAIHWIRDHTVSFDFKGPDAPMLPAVGSFTPNAFGLHDMHGSVWEWCRDWHGLWSVTAGGDTDPDGPATGRLRVLRGGSYLTSARDCRSAFRNATTPLAEGGTMGFRVVVELPAATVRPVGDRID